MNTTPLYLVTEPKAFLELEPSAAIQAIMDSSLPLPTKNDLFKSMIKRDFPSRYKDFVKENANTNKDYGVIYQQLSDFVFGRDKDGAILRRLFHWIRTSNIEEIQQFLKAQSSFHYLHKLNKDGISAVSLASELSPDILEMFYQFEFWKRDFANIDDRFLSYFAEIFFNISYKKTATANMLLNELPTKISLSKIVKGRFLELVIRAIQTNQLELVTNIIQLTASAKINLEKKLRESIYKNFYSDELFEFFGSTTAFFVASFYQRIPSINYFVDNILYSRDNSTLRADVFIAAAASGNFDEIFSHFFGSAKTQVNYLEEMRATATLQSNHFSVFCRFEFLLVAIAMARLDFVQKYAALKCEDAGEKAFLSEAWGQVCRNRTGWKHLGHVLTIKTAALQTGMMEVVKSFNLTWEKQFAAIEKFVSGNSFNKIFPGFKTSYLPFDFDASSLASLNDVNKVILLVCFDAVSAIFRNFEPELQTQLFKELAVACSQKYAKLLDMAVNQVLKQYDENEQTRLLNVFLERNQNHQENNHHSKRKRAAQKVTEVSSLLSTETLDAEDTDTSVASQNSPKKQQKLMEDLSDSDKENRENFVANRDNGVNSVSVAKLAFVGTFPSPKKQNSSVLETKTAVFSSTQNLQLSPRSHS